MTEGNGLWCMVAAITGPTTGLLCLIFSMLNCLNKCPSQRPQTPNATLAISCPQEML